MVLPSRRFLVLLAVPVLPLLLLPRPATFAFAVAWDVALALAAILDAWLPPRTRDMVVTRHEKARFSLGVPTPVGWTLRNLSRYPARFELLDDLPPTFLPSEESVHGALAPASHASVGYDVRPTERGLHRLRDVHLRLDSFFGLVKKQARLPTDTTVKVYPNIASLARNELGGARAALFELGVRPTQSRGEGSDFESLRDYVIGDSPSDIAWKATARRGRPITRTYQVDRSQSVLVVLDCGRLMTTEVAGLSRLDHAINATLLLSYVTVKQGDTIGLLAFSDTVEAYVPPIRGKAALGRMSEALYRLEARPREASYERACEFLALRHRKRSLIVIVTDVVDNDASSALLAHAARFARRHLPLCVTLKNLDVERLATDEPADETAAYTQAVALDLLYRRRVALEHLRRSGVDVLDVDPRQLGPRVITRYLELKRRMRI
jgi:uncharacterized protein (DUF58 family)